LCTVSFLKLNDDDDDDDDDETETKIDSYEMQLKLTDKNR